MRDTLTDSRILIMNVIDKMELIETLFEKGKIREYCKTKLKEMIELDDKIATEQRITFNYNEFEQSMFQLLNDMDKVTNVIDEYKAFQRSLDYIKNKYLKIRVIKTIEFMENEKIEIQHADELYNKVVKELDSLYGQSKTDNILDLNFHNNSTSYEEMMMNNDDLYILGNLSNALNKARLIDNLNEIKNRNNYRQVNRLINYIMGKLGEFNIEDYKNIKKRINELNNIC